MAVDAIWSAPDPTAHLGGATPQRFLLAESLKAGRAGARVLGSPPSSAKGALGQRCAGASVSIGEQAAELVTRLLAGERTARGSLLSFRRLQLVINKKIADKLKIEIPADALKAASRVF